MSKKPSRFSPLVLSTVTAFLHQQDGETELVDLTSAICDEVLKQNEIVWIEADVKSVLRAADQRGSAIELVDKTDERTRELYEEAMNDITNSGGTRAQKRQLTNTHQPIIKAFKALHPHHHDALSLARLALHRAARRVRERNVMRVQEEKEEDRKMKEVKQKMKKDKLIEESKKRDDAKKEKAEKKKAAVLAAIEAAKGKTRAINKEKGDNLMELNIDRWRTKAQDARNKAKLVEEALFLVQDMRAKQSTNTDKEEKKGEEKELAWDDKENEMP